MQKKLRIMLAEVYGARAVVGQLVRQQLILRYRRTVFGFLWTLINPLMMMTITAVVFSNLFKTDLKTFAVFMFAGMVPWNCFSSIVTQSASSFILNEGLIRKIYLPKIIFPLSISLGILIDSLLSLAALFVIIFIMGGTASWALLFLPVAYVLLFVFSFGIALFMAVMTVFLRDLQHVITIALQALFFLTPIIYDKTAVVGRLGAVLDLNPLAVFVALFRAPIRYGVMPDSTTIFVACGLALVSLAVSMAIFLAQEKKIVFRL
ncbi:MAG: ABC transporter permease [Alphaproteobacteria bacterium]|nr:ABC transporter permease [Alphaproteobacteria bacterium]